MESPLLIWVLALAACLLVVLYHAVHNAHMHVHKQLHHRHVITRASESDEIYVPGDPRSRDAQNLWDGNDL